MVAGTHTDVVLIQNLGDVVWMHRAVFDAQDAAAAGWFGRTVDDDLVAVTFGQRPHRIRGELGFMFSHDVHADGVEVVDGGSEADGLADHRRPGFELPGELVRGESLFGHLKDHLAAAEEGGHGLEELFAGPEHADAHGAQHLVAGERHEIGAHLLHIGR